jgi:hypothetical protein
MQIQTNPQYALELLLIYKSSVSWSSMLAENEVPHAQQQENKQNTLVVHKLQTI